MTTATVAKLKHAQVEQEIDLPRRASILKQLLRDKRATAGLIVLVIIVIATIFADVIAPHDPRSQEFDIC